MEIQIHSQALELQLEFRVSVVMDGVGSEEGVSDSPEQMSHGKDHKSSVAPLPPATDIPHMTAQTGHHRACSHSSIKRKLTHQTS